TQRNRHVACTQLVLECGGIEPAGRAQTEQVGAPPGTRLDGKAERLRLFDQLRRQRRAVVLDARRSPLEHTVERSVGDWHEDEVAALADVVADRAGLVLVAVVDEGAEIRAVPRSEEHTSEL